MLTKHQLTKRTLASSRFGFTLWVVPPNHLFPATPPPQHPSSPPLPSYLNIPSSFSIRGTAHSYSPAAHLACCRFSQRQLPRTSPRLLQYTCPRNSGRASLVGSSTLQIQAQNQTSPVRTIVAGPSTEVQVTPPTEALEIPPATLLSRSRETTLHLPLPQTFRPTTHNIQLPIHNSPHPPAQALLPPRNPPHHQALPLYLYLSLISAKELLQLQK